MDFTVRMVKEANGDVVVVIVPGEGASEEQAEYLASALSDLLDWDILYSDTLLYAKTTWDRPLREHEAEYEQACRACGAVLSREGHQSNCENAD